jgi:hypothetical protein
MLAYVFWHWMRPDASHAAYEDRLVAFHGALAAAPPSGFTGSRAFAMRGAPWAGAGGDAFEDWYLVEDSAALDPLNEAAVSGMRRGPHDAAASLLAGGTAGLYRLRRGNPAGATGVANWFAKPDGVSYPDFLESLRPVVETHGGALWMRQMTLGPAREFCLHTTEPVALPPVAGALTLRLRTVFPRAA